jgi:alkylhydroperoxidase/carboxymuconolactone decarboxylase family protein YurZ
MPEKKLPENFLRFTKTHPRSTPRSRSWGGACTRAASLSERERRLVKLGIAVGIGTEGGVHSAVRFAKAGGCSRDDLAHVVRLAITTIGWPSALAAMSWVDDLNDDVK